MCEAIAQVGAIAVLTERIAWSVAFKTAVFMGKVGTIKDRPASWKDLFFPPIHAVPGS